MVLALAKVKIGLESHFKNSRCDAPSLVCATTYWEGPEE